MDTRRRRLTFRCWRRGFREIDLILGHFVDAHVAGLTNAELDVFEALLDESDQDIYDWVIGRREAPEHHQSAVLARLQKLDYLGSDLRVALQESS
jgi:antitoxin CptB